MRKSVASKQTNILFFIDFLYHLGQPYLFLFMHWYLCRQQLCFVCILSTLCLFCKQKSYRTFSCFNLNNLDTIAFDTLPSSWLKSKISLCWFISLTSYFCCIKDCSANLFFLCKWASRFVYFLSRSRLVSIFQATNELLPFSKSSFINSLASFSFSWGLLLMVLFDLFDLLLFLLLKHFYTRVTISMVQWSEAVSYLVIKHFHFLHRCTSQWWG